ncbi:MAG TPA: VWA domain-containing protein, partial [Alphaproteobacteria bacterium]|nr:VWA domain-containing protein [Alphaproteobacteria bacterium]
MKALKFIALGLTLLTVFVTGGCDKANTVAPTRGVYMLIDTSGTYTNELKKAQTIINFVLAKLNPGDSFAVASINTGSFTEKDI